MEQVRSGRLRRTALAIAIIGALAGAITMGAKVMSASEDPGTKRTVAGGSDVAEGLEVHGHWQIDVRNPDGSLASSREFENAFVGHAQLTDVLIRARTPGPWVVTLIGATANPCKASNSSTRTTCRIWESDADVNASTNFFKTLTKEDLGSSFKLRGTATAAFDGDVGHVGTDFGTCGSGTGPGFCHEPSSGPAFTGTSVSPAVEVLQGQQILVVVTISFS